MLSLYYNTFGDYRPTGIFYITIPSLLVFGQTIFAVRFPSALFGALTIIPLYFFTKEFSSKRIALFSAVFLALSPWHISVSRATSEVVISGFFTISALFLLVRNIKNGNHKYNLVICVFIGLGYLFYHAIRFLAPPFFIITAFFYIKDIIKLKSRYYILVPLIFVVSLSIIFSITKEARKRFDQVSILNDANTIYQIDRLQKDNLNKYSKLFDNKLIVYTYRFVNEYTSYFNSNFLIGDSAKPYRYITPGVGLITYIEFILLFCGLIAIIQKKMSLLPVFLLLVSPLPSALTIEDTPNLHRSFLMILFLVIIEAYGLEIIINFNKYVKYIISILLILYLYNFTYFTHMYFNHSHLHKPYIKDLNLDGSSYRNVGTLELVSRIESAKNFYDKIIVTNSSDDPYPWYAFFTNKSAKDFNKFSQKRTEGPWQYEKIIFSQLKCPSDSYFNIPDQKILVIDSGAPGCQYDTKIKDGLMVRVIRKIYRTDKSEAFVFLERSI